MAGLATGMYGGLFILIKEAVKTVGEERIDMITKIIMPKLGVTMEKGTLMKWLKRINDEIKVGEEIVEIDTGKINNIVESECSGILLAITVQEGEDAPVNAILGYIGNKGDLVPDTEMISYNESAKGLRKNNFSIVLTATAKMAEAKGLNPAMITGTGADGLITVEDILAYEAELREENINAEGGNV